MVQLYVELFNLRFFTVGDLVAFAFDFKFQLFRLADSNLFKENTQNNNNSQV